MKILKFTAPWCPSCRHMSNIIFDLPEDKRDLFEEINIETDEGSDLADHYSIKSLPTLVVLNSDGKEEMRRIGSVTKSHLEEIINTYLS